MMTKNYYITIVSVWNREQSCIVSHNGYIEGEDMNEINNKLHSYEFLVGIFKNQFSGISWEQLCITYLNIW